MLVKVFTKIKGGLINMKVKEIIRQITDPKLTIEIIEEGSGASFGFYTKNELFYLEKYTKATVKNINVQFLSGQRLLIIKVKF